MGSAPFCSSNATTGPLPASSGGAQVELRWRSLEIKRSSWVVTGDHGGARGRCLPVPAAIERGVKPAFEKRSACAEAARSAPATSKPLAALAASISGVMPSESATSTL